MVKAPEDENQKCCCPFCKAGKSCFLQTKEGGLPTGGAQIICYRNVKKGEDSMGKEREGSGAGLRKERIYFFKN
jgi:hypothetical protein